MKPLRYVMASLCLAACSPSRRVTPPPAAADGPPSAATQAATPSGNTSATVTAAPSNRPPSTGPAKPPAPSPNKVATAPRPKPLRGVLHSVLETKGSDHELKHIGEHNGAPVFTRGIFGSDKMLLRSSRDGAFAFDERWTTGLSVSFINYFIGDLDKEPVLLGLDSTGRIGWSLVFRRKNGVWRRTKKLPQGAFYAGIGRWSQGRTLGYFKPFPFNQTGRYAFELLSPGSRADLPVPAMQPKTADQTWQIQPEVEPRQLAIFESGHVVVISETHSEHFAPGKTKGKIVPLPAVATSELLAQRGLADVVIPAQGVLLRFDGKNWQELPAPTTDAPTGLVFQGEALWLATAKGLWRYQNKTWQAIAVPPGTNVAALSATDQAVWVLLHNTKTKTLILQSSQPSKAEVQRLKLPPHDTKQFATRSLRLPKPARAGCDSIFALLFGVTKYAGPNYDFPLTRKALRGHKEFAKARFVKTIAGKQKYFGAFVPTLALGRKLTALIRKKVNNSAPQLLCHQPKVLAELDFDLNSGKSKGWKAVAEATESK